VIIPTVITNTAEFNRTLEEVAKHSSRTYPQIVNGQGLALAVDAIKETMKADADKVAHELGQIATKIPKLYQGKRGKARFSHRVFRTDIQSLAARIINARRINRKPKLKPIFGDELDKVARNMIAARLKAIGFVRSGWVYAVRTLSRAVGYQDVRSRTKSEAARMTGQAKGYARVARTQFNDFVTCDIANTALLGKGGRSAMPIAQAGLQRAMQLRIADMKRHMQERLQKVFNKYNAK
jgi:hypothetical protein